MVTRFITKGKGKNRKSFPITPKKKGVTVRSVSLQPSVVGKVNREQIKILNRGETATFSKALNQVVMRARRDGIPIYDTHVNSNDRRKPYHMWIVKHPEKGDKIKGSDTIVMAEHYGQAIDDMITIWNKEKRMKKTIGYPQVQGTADKSFRFKRSSSKVPDVTKIIAFESGDLNTQGTLELFADLIKSGTVWNLQGSYGRMAESFIENEIISKEGKILKDAEQLRMEEGFD